MNIRHTLGLAVVLVAATALSALAHGRGFQRSSLQEQLGLSDEQQTQIADLRDRFGEDSQALHDAYKADINAVFSEEQLAAIDAYHAERATNRRTPRPELNISEEQKAALGELREVYKEARSALIEAHKLAFADLLSEEQLALLEELKAARHSRHRGDKSGREDTETDNEEETQTSEATLQAFPNTPATAVESSSWGRIKGSLTD